MEQYTYLLLDLGAISIPLLFSFHRKSRFADQWRHFWPACLTIATAFIAWDVAFTSMGVWGFNPRYLIGIDLLGLPLEEWLFFICIPYACVFTYHAMHVWADDPWIPGIARAICWSLAVALIMIALLHLDRWYTATTFLSLGALLAWLGWKDPQYLGRFLSAYIILIIPFLLINGVLTGSWIEDPVVWYSDAENLGLRLGTIPVEDVFYGMLLVGLNVVLFEAIRQSPSNSYG